MSYLFGEAKPATEMELNGRWSGGKPGKNFRCAFCGYKFQLGDLWRGVYTNDLPAWGNPLVCQTCDVGNDALRQRWSEMHREVESRFWWFVKDRD